MMREKRIPCANGIWSVGGRNWNEDFEMPADDCNCTGHFGVDAFCLAAGQGAEFESCDPGLGVWVNDVNKSGMKRSRTMGDETQCPASWLFGMNGSVFLVFAFGFVWKHHFKFTRR